MQRQGGKQLLLFCSVYRSSNTEDILWILSLTIRFPDWHDVLPGIFGTSVDTNGTSRAPIRVTDISMHEQHEHAFDLTPVDVSSPTPTRSGRAPAAAAKQRRRRCLRQRRLCLLSYRLAALLLTITQAASPLACAPPDMVRSLRTYCRTVHVRRGPACDAVLLVVCKNDSDDFLQACTGFSDSLMVGDTPYKVNQ